jgi:ubiquitin-protein ligase
MPNIRQRRLKSDYKKLMNFFKEHPYIEINSLGEAPPEKYLVKYNNIRGLKLDEGKNTPTIITQHTVEIYLHSYYPRKAPQCTIKTPAFHPNISAGIVCVVDDIDWTPQYDPVTLIFRIGSMLQYQDYNLESPRNGTAANWVKRNKHIFPIGNISLPDTYARCTVQESDIILPPILPKDKGIILFEMENIINESRQR